MNTARRGFGVTATLVLLALSACGNDMDKSTSEMPSAQTAAAEVNDSGDDDSDDKSISGGGETAADTTVVNEPAGGQQPNVIGDISAGRALVITMTVGVEVTDAADAVDEVIALAGRHGGQLYNSDLDLTDPATASGDLVFKLPPGQVQAFLSGLEPGIGRRTGMEGNTADVTKQLSDLDAQILTAETSVDRVRLLLAAATTLDDVIRLEDELASRETHLEQLRAQKSNLDSQVAMATITVHLTTAPPVEEEAPAPEKKKDETGVSDAFRDGWKGFVNVLRGIALVIGYTAPFLAIAFIVGFVWWRISRRRPAPTRSRSTAPPHPPTPDEDPHTSTPDSVGAARIP